MSPTSPIPEYWRSMSSWGMESGPNVKSSVHSKKFLDNAMLNLSISSVTDSYALVIAIRRAASDIVELYVGHFE